MKDEQTLQEEWTAAREMYTTSNLVFVYGTLKRGRGNNGLLSSSECLGEDRTPEGWVMGAGGCPYAFPPHVVPTVYKEQLARRIKGEVYRVPNAAICYRLDRLEGYPWHYGREVIRTENGHRAWIYTMNDWQTAHRLNAVTATPEGEWVWP